MLEVSLCVCVCVTPLFKKGSTDDTNNYRPILILPVTSMKIFEKIVHRQAIEFLNSSKHLKFMSIWFQEYSFY